MLKEDLGNSLTVLYDLILPNKKHRKYPDNLHDRDRKTENRNIVEDILK